MIYDLPFLIVAVVLYSRSVAVLSSSCTLSVLVDGCSQIMHVFRDPGVIVRIIITIDYIGNIP